jgi:hypothetical protein
MAAPTSQNQAKEVSPRRTSYLDSVKTGFRRLVADMVAGGPVMSDAREYGAGNEPVWVLRLGRAMGKSVWSTLPPRVPERFASLLFRQ